MLPWAAGAQVGPYVLVSQLGVGGMGEVWKARDDRLDRIVAIKHVINPDASRFQQEARAIAALNHPNICQIYDVGPDYLVMEYIEGSPLQGPMGTDDAVRMAIQIAAALEEAHGKRILHRDLKPANILVTVKGVPKLLDFGLARLMSNIGETKTTAVMGTPLYSSPEQTEGRHLDERSDIFSFGAVLYEMLSGRRAFATLAAALRDDPEPIHGSAGTIAMRCLAKQPAARFQRFDEVRCALERTLTKSSEHPSIAVLPFANMSLDKDQEFFSDGLAEEIIYALAQIPGLKVTARTSAFAFRGREQDIRRIAEALDVRTILEGSVRRAGSRIRVTAELINAADGYQLWSQRYDRELADVFEVQDEIATAIAATLRVKLARSPDAPARYRPNIPAYEEYLKGRHIWAARRTMDALEKARAHYERAIELDPKFAVAASELAGHFIMQALVGQRPPNEVVPAARMWCQRAHDLDPDLPDAHAVLGGLAGVWDHDWTQARRRFALALAREPVSGTVRMQYGVYSIAIGRPLDALDQFRRASSEDPLSLTYQAWAAISLMAAGRSDEAAAELRQLVERDKSFPGPFTYLAWYHAARGEFREALPFAKKRHEIDPHSPTGVGTLAPLFVRNGETSRANALLDTLGSPETYGVPRAHFLCHLILGDSEQAADWWGKMSNQQDAFSVLIPRIPLASVLLASRRWPELSKRLNLPEESRY